MTLVLLSGGGSHARPAPQPQAPYVVDTTGNPVTTLPAGTVLPQPFTGPIWLESAWSMRIDGLPWLPGATSSKHPERCLTWFMGAPAWKPWVDKILTAAAVRGMNTLTLSWPDAQDYCGMSVQSFVALCAYVKSWGFRVHVKYWAKASNTVWSSPQNADWSVFGPYVTPVLQALLSAKAVDEVSPWEWNANNIAGPVGEANLDNVTAMVTPAGVRSWYHGTPGNTWWGDGSIDNRFTWMAKRVAAGMTGLQYQSWPIQQPGTPDRDDRWNVGTLQARILDSTGNPAWAATGAQFLAWEIDGAEEFDEDWPDETTAAMHGFLSLCTPGIVRVTGTGNGIWLPTGQPATLAA